MSAPQGVAARVGGLITHQQIHYDPCCDYYERLGVSPYASPTEMLRAYRIAVKKHHPDTGGDPTGHQVQTIYQAYTVLRDPFKRACYNCSRNRFGRPVSYSETPAAPRRAWPRGLHLSRGAAAAVSLALGVALLAAAVVAARERPLLGSSSYPSLMERDSPRNPAPGPSIAAALFGYVSSSEPDGAPRIVLMDRDRTERGMRLAGWGHPACTAAPEDIPPPHHLGLQGP